MTWQPIATAPRDGTKVLVVTALGAHDTNVRIASAYPGSGWLTDNGTWLTPSFEPTHWQPLPSADTNAPSDGEIKRMLLDVLLGIGMIFHCTLEEMQEDPSIIITRIEQSLGPKGPRSRRDA